MECFMIIVNGFHPLTIIIKHSILDVAVGPNPPLVLIVNEYGRFQIIALHRDGIKLLKNSHRI